MLALAMEETAVRGFMNRLLKEDIFDSFEVRSVEITALTHIAISGARADGGEERALATWQQIKPLAEAIIRCQMPRAVKVIFSADAQTVAAIHPNASALFLNMAYENSAVQFTAATAQREFALDKTLDASWEAHITSFFESHGLPVKRQA